MEKTLDYYMSLDYPVEIRRIDESLGGGYVATIPSLGAQAFVGDGETPQEAYENLQAAKKEIFAEYLQVGVAIPEPVVEPAYEDYSGKLMLRLPRELHAKLAVAAKRNETSLNQFIVYALSSFEAKWDVFSQVKRALATTSTAFANAWANNVMIRKEEPAAKDQPVVVSFLDPTSSRTAVSSRLH